MLYTHALSPEESKNEVAIASVSASGYTFIHRPRTTGPCGGVGFLCRNSIHMKQVNKRCTYKSFEHMEITLTIKGEIVNVIVVYRPPPNSKNGFTPNQFLEEFNDLMDKKIVEPGKLLITGDFNFHMDKLDDNLARNFRNALSPYGLTQHVPLKPTQKKGHTLDLVITRSDDDLVTDCKIVSEPALSDHYWISGSLKIQKPQLPTKLIKFRKIKNINQQVFQADISNSLTPVSMLNSCDDMVKEYDQVLQKQLDMHAPEKMKIITLHPQAEWYNESILEAKRSRRKAERQWRKTGLVVHREIYIQKKNHVSYLIKIAKKAYYTNKIKNTTDQKSLYNIVNSLTSNKTTTYPEAVSDKCCAENFSTYFSNKISSIRDELSTAVERLHESDPIPPPEHELHYFEPSSEEEIKKIISSAKSTTCSSDPIPTNLLKKSLGSLLTFITAIVNISLETATMPMCLKKATVVPLLKKPSLDSDILKNF
jgi:hypothetical protein